MSGCKELPMEIWNQIHKQSEGFEQVNLWIALRVEVDTRLGFCYVNDLPKRLRLEFACELGAMPTYKNLIENSLYSIYVESRLNYYVSNKSDQVSIIHGTEAAIPDFLKQKIFSYECSECYHVTQDNKLYQWKHHCQHCDIEVASCQIYPGSDWLSWYGGSSQIPILVAGEDSLEHISSDFDEVPKSPKAYSGCGHMSSEGRCAIMCDDFIDNLGEGFCYLKAFNDKNSAIKALQRFPSASKFQLYLMNNEFEPFQITADPSKQTLHVFRGEGNDDRIVQWNGLCNFCNKTSKLQSDAFVPTFRVACPYCENEMEVDCLFDKRFLHYRVGALAGFTLRNLLSAYETSTRYSSRDPWFYTSTAVQTLEATATIESSSDVTIRCGGYELMGAPSSRRIQTQRHDFVASCWRDKTDEELILLGIPYPEGKMTPDCIMVNTNNVLELGTCNTDNRRALKAMYEAKIIRYSGDLASVNAGLYILIVAPQTIYTNLTLEQWQIDELTLRMRAASIVEPEIERLTGMDIFNSDLSEQIKLVKETMESIKDYAPELPEVFYSNAQIAWFRDSPTDEDYKYTKQILEQSLKTTEVPDKPNRIVLEQYLANFTSENSRRSQKRITNLPVMLPVYGIVDMSLDTDMPPGLHEVWSGSMIVNAKQRAAEDKVAESLYNQSEEGLHRVKRESMFHVSLSQSQKLELALSGVGGKALDSDLTIQEHQATSKKSFHPDTSTKDIDDFLAMDIFQPNENKFVTPILKRAIKESKYLNTGGRVQESTKIWERILNTEVISYCCMISEIFIELSYCYKHWTGGYSFLKKKLSNGVEMVIYNPKNIMFVSFAFPLEDTRIWDTGRLGPRMYKSSTHYFTEFSSFDTSTVEHFIKCGPYMHSIAIHLQSAAGSTPGEFNSYSRNAMSNMLLLYLNNKTDVEELITSQRYLFMKLLEDVSPSSYTFVERLPSVMRSRLTVHYLKKTVELLDFYAHNRISKIPKQGENMILYDYVGIKSIFSNQNISLQMKINEFYYGYVVSKEHNAGSDKTYKVLSKLIAQDHKFRDTVKNIFTEKDEQQFFCTNKHLLRVFGHNFAEMIKEKFGDRYKQKIYEDYVYMAANTSFSELATLKASARNHEIDFQTYVGEDTASRIYDVIKENNPEEAKKRPKMMSAITIMIKEYEKDTGKKAIHIVQLLPWCLEYLMNKGYFDSDEFDKDQHGGEREIHVLEVKARIVQFFVEVNAKVICEYFPSETTVNYQTKEHFVRDHYTECAQKLTEHFVSSKSADATKWCQLHHSSHFAAMYQCVLPKELLPFVMAALSLWPRKRLSFPLKQVGNLQANLKTYSSNKTYLRFRKEFSTGTGMFVKKLSNIIHVVSGMFQGILHKTSSLYHTMIQEVMKRVVLTFASEQLHKKCVMTVIEGSDDSGALLGMEGKPNKRNFIMAKRLLLWKERVSPYLSVYCNEPKSSIGTHDIIEYNSEWHSRHKIIKPTFRWISACLEVSVTERFVDRYRMFNNMLTECLTGGATTLECAVIQHNQSMMHYMLLGFQTQNTSEYLWEYMEKNPEPLLGFFPSDFDVSAGVTGPEFQLYSLYKFTSYGRNLKDRASADVELSYSPEELPNYLKVKDLTSTRLKFGDNKLFAKLVDTMPLESLEVALKTLNDDPLLLFDRARSWEEEQHSLVLKLFSPGVKESISNRSSVTRMAASSAYVQTACCFSNNTKTKMSLLKLLSVNASEIQTKTKEDESVLFPLYHEFNSVLKVILSLTDDSVVVSQEITRTSKSKVTVFEVPEYEFQVIDMCKRAYFGFGKIPLGRKQFQDKWEALCDQSGFLSKLSGLQGYIQTCKNLRMDAVQTKNFLESLNTRTRSITLYDTSSKGTNLTYSLSRLYWPDRKLFSSGLNESTGIDDLRSKIFSRLSFWETRDIKQREITKDIYKCEDLESSIRDLPTKAIKLKLIYDTLHRRDKVTILSEIMSIKQGTLGYFSHVQTGFGKDRSGTGIWVGNVCGISCEIHMNKNICTKIIVNHLSNSISLGFSLKRLIDDFNLIKPTTTVLSKTSVWLSDSGKIVPTSRQIGIPIYQNPEIRFTSFEGLEEQQWYVDINNMNIRIRIIDTSGSPKHYTILSDTYHSSDWIPGRIINSGDLLYDKWSSGSTCPLSMLQETIGDIVPKSRGKFMQFMKSLNSIETNLNWNLQSLRTTLASAFSAKGMKTTSHILDEVIPTNKSNEAWNLYQATANLDLSEDTALDELIADWAKEDELDFGMDVDDMEMEGIDALISMLDTGSENFETYLDSGLTTFTMPSMNRFFHSLESASQIATHKSMRENLKMPDSYHVEGIVGQVISLIRGDFMYGRETGELTEVYDWEDKSHTMSESMSEMNDLDRINLAQLENLLEDLEDSIHTAKPSVRPKLEKTYRMYQRMRDLKLNITSEGVETMDYELVMKLLFKKLKMTGKMDVNLGQSEDLLCGQVMSVYINNSVDQEENKLTVMEQLNLKSSIALKKVNHNLLDFISGLYEIKISTEWAVFGSDEYELFNLSGVGKPSM